MAKKLPTKPAAKITITGEIHSITFRNSTGWAVFTILETAKGPMQGITTKCTGVLAEMIDRGTEVTATGIMETNKFGTALKCEQIVPQAPDVSTETGVVKLLQRLPGIGPKKAMQAVQQFGHEEAWKLAGSDPEKIGVKADDCELAITIASSLLGSYEATVYLLGIGLTDHQANTIYNIYGRDTIKIVSETPYQLTEIDGFGFITVDKIALKAGISVGNQSRINACILWVLDDSSNNGGNIWHTGWSLVDTVLDTLTETAMKAEVPLRDAPLKEDIRRQVHFLANEKKVFIENGRVYSVPLLEAERVIFDFIAGEVGSGQVCAAVQ